MIHRDQDHERERQRLWLRRLRSTLSLALFFWAVYVVAQAFFTVQRFETFETDLRSLSLELNTVGRTAYLQDFSDAARRNGVKLKDGDVTVEVSPEEYRIAAWYSWEVDLGFRTVSGRWLSQHKAHRWPNGAW